MTQKELNELLAGLPGARLEYTVPRSLRRFRTNI